MKELYWVGSLALCFLPISTKGQSVNARTEGNCSPIFINVSSPAPIKVDCGVDTKKIQDEINNSPAVRELVSTIVAVKSLKIEAVRLSDEAQKNSALTKNGENQLSRLKNDFKNLQASLNQKSNFLERQVGAVESDLNKILGEFGAKVDLADLERARVEIFDGTEVKIEDTRRLIQSEVALLDIRLNRVESDVSYLMAEYLSGNFKDAVSFVGVEVMPIKVGHDEGGSIAIEYESLTPSNFLGDKKLSVIASAGYQQLNVTGSFATTPGAPSIQTEKSNSGPFVRVGGRVFPTHFDGGAAYFSTSFGIVKAGGVLPFASVGVGVEYFRKSMRAAFEINSGFRRVNYSSLQFDLAGSGSYAPNGVKSSSFVGLAFRTSFR